LTQQEGITEKEWVMEKLSRIEWLPLYSVNNEEIDAQHRKLFDITNHLMDLFERDAGDLLPVLKGLIAYVIEHFHTERTVMIKANFPGFLMHNQEHQIFTEKMKEFLDDYQAGNKDLAFDMISYLKNWINDHTTKVDMEYAKYLQKASGSQR
jgi:hemerythrin-like metal-binding protein